MNTSKIQEKFKSLYETEGTLYSSPGRINIIGEHTDYNGGFVLPGAIDKAMFCEIKPNGTNKVRVYALDLNESCEFGLEESDKPAQQWACYIFGMCREMAKKCGVTGSRVMGGGFGGCTINLVREDKYDEFLEKTTEAYEKEFGIKAKVYDVVIKDGAHKL